MVDGSRRSSRVADRHAKEEADQAKRREERRKRKEKEAKGRGTEVGERVEGCRGARGKGLCG